MWRAVVAMVHADGVVTPHEMAFVQCGIKNLALSSEQMDIISGDLKTPQDSYEMYSQITHAKDKLDYFSLARAVSWCDGDLDRQEKLIIENLEKIHMNESEMAMLEKSREVTHEIELCQDQWRMQNPQMKNSQHSRNGIFDFFSKFASA